MPGVRTRREIESLADPGSFLRGVGYQRAGRVDIGDRHGDAVTAVVRGSMPYQVELHRSPKVAWSCTCPVGEEGTFCKHCVAVALEEAGPDRQSSAPTGAATRSQMHASSSPASTVKPLSISSWSRSTRTGGSESD